MLLIKGGNDMKNLIILFSLFILFSCTEVQQNNQETEKKIEKNFYPISKDMEVIYKYDFPGEGKPVCLTKIDDTYIIGMPRKILVSTDTEKWVQTTIFEDETPYILQTVDNIVFLSTVSGLTSSNIYQSRDKGQTWEKIYISNNYVITLSRVKKGNSIAVGLYHQTKNVMKRFIDFGWYNLSCQKIENINRIATAHDIIDEYPSEISIIKRDHAIIAAIRWSDYPREPYTQLQISYNNGETWEILGKLWSGIAGKLTILEEGYFAGYLCIDSIYKYTVVGKFDLYTGEVREIFYPFGKGEYRKNRGNGQAIWDDGYLTIFEGNNSLKKGNSFAKIEG
jgi:hypothetical protein